MELGASLKRLRKYMKISLQKNEKYIIGRFDHAAETISSSFYNGGKGKRNGFFILQVERDFNTDDPSSLARGFERSMDLDRYVGFLTAVNLSRNTFLQEDERFFILATIGLGHHCIPGKICKSSRTINIISVVKERLTENAAMDLLSVMISTKVFSLTSRGYGAGTPSDSFMLSYLKGSDIFYGGFATDIGRALSSLILKIMEDGIREWERSGVEY
ncbi:MAG: adenosylcobinamide amidohydrolase [Thermoplasmata archaeon]